MRVGDNGVDRFNYAIRQRIRSNRYRFTYAGNICFRDGRFGVVFFHVNVAYFLEGRATFSDRFTCFFGSLRISIFCFDFHYFGDDQVDALWVKGVNVYCVLRVVVNRWINFVQIYVRCFVTFPFECNLGTRELIPCSSFVMTNGEDTARCR